MCYSIDMNNKKENFKRVAENRTNKIINMISLLGNLNNTSFYDYNDEEIEAIFEAIHNELDKQYKKLTKKNTGKKRFQL